MGLAGTKGHWLQEITVAGSVLLLALFVADGSPVDNSNANTLDQRT